MHVIAVTINKGGVGKTMLSRSLAACAAKAGLFVLVVDMDLQQNATKWGRRRSARLGPDALPLVQFTTENDLAEIMARARSAGCDLVVIDTPPARSTEAPAAVEQADLVVVPFTADIEAFEALEKTIRLARTEGKRAIGVLNQATPNSMSEIDAARDVLAKVGLAMSPVVLHRYKLHRDASRDGLAAAELEPDSKAAAEVQSLYDYLTEQLHACTTARVRKGGA